mgnify:CR=1 FL=1
MKKFVYGGLCLLATFSVVTIMSVTMMFIGIPERTLIPADCLVQSLKSDSSSERSLCYYSISQYSKEQLGEQTIRAVRDHLTEAFHRNEIKESELYAIAYLMANSKHILPDQLPKAILDAIANCELDHTVRRLFIKTVANYDEAGRDALHVLSSLVCGTRCSSADLAYHAAVAIGNIGPPVSEDTIDALKCGARKGRLRLQRACMMSLMSLGDLGYIALEDLSRDKSENVSLLALGIMDKHKDKTN